MRLQRLIQSLNSSIAGGALLIAFFSVISKILGLYRDRLLAATFGASRITDIYFASFKIPDFIFNILVLGALTSSFIPVFQKAWHRDPSYGIKLSNSVLNTLLLTMGVIVVIVFLGADYIIPLTVPGFSPEEVRLTTAMTRTLLVSLLFFSASNVLSGILNSWKKFFTFALSSVVYNIGIIVGILILFPRFGYVGLPLGVVLGSFFHCAIQLFEAFRNGWRYRLIFFFDASMKRIFTLMIPRTLGLVANQVETLILTMIASTLPIGSLAVFSYANNLQGFPISIIGVSLAVAAFPSFSRTIADNNLVEFRRLFVTQMRRVLYFLLPISVLLVLLRAHIVRVILGSGSFDWYATVGTAQALGILALSIFAQGLLPLMVRSFYAFEDTRRPTLISIFTIAFDIVLALTLAKKFGILGVTFAMTLSNILNFVLLVYFFQKKYIKIVDRIFLLSLRRMFLLTCASGSLTYLTLQFTAPFFDGHSFVGIFLQGFIAGCVGLLVYLLLSILLQVEEVHLLMTYLKKLLKPLSNGK